MKKPFIITLSLILLIFNTTCCFCADQVATPTNQVTTNDNQNKSNTSTDTANFKLHTGYHDMFMHYDRYLNMKVGEKTKIYIYIPEKLFEGAKVTEITNNFPAYVSYSGDGTVEALKSIGYGRCLKIHTTVYLPKEDRYEHFTTKIHTYN